MGTVHFLLSRVRSVIFNNSQGSKIAFIGNNQSAKTLWPFGLCGNISLRGSCWANGKHTGSDFGAQSEMPLLGSFTCSWYSLTYGRIHVSDHFDVLNIDQTLFITWLLSGYEYIVCHLLSLSESM